MQITSLSLQSDTLGFIFNILHHCSVQECSLKVLLLPTKLKRYVKKKRETFKLLCNEKRAHTITRKEPILSISRVKIK